MSRAPHLAPASRVGNSRRPHGVVVPRGRRVYRSRERFEAEPAVKVALCVAVASGFACGVYYFTRGGFGGTGVYLAAAGFVLAMLLPASGIILAIVAALGVPLAWLAMQLAGATVHFPPEPNVAATLLALLPTLAGAMLALGIRWVLLRPDTPVRR